MRRAFLLCCSLIFLGVSVAHAQGGVNLRWTNCYGDAGASLKTFACNTNVGAHALVGSFELPWDMSPVSGLEIIVDITAQNPTLPAWWQFRNAGTCRQASLAMNFTIPGTAVNCVDWADGQAAGGIGAYNIGFQSANRARVIAAEAVPISSLATLFTGQEYFAFNLVILNQKTVGTGACVGCDVPAGIVLSSLKVTTPVAANDITMTSPTAANSNAASWQSVPVPTRRQTWGEVKSLFR